MPEPKDRLEAMDLMNSSVALANEIYAIPRLITESPLVQAFASERGIPEGLELERTRELVRCVAVHEILPVVYETMIEVARIESVIRDQAAKSQPEDDDGLSEERRLSLLHLAAATGARRYDQVLKTFTHATEIRRAAYAEVFDEIVSVVSNVVAMRETTGIAYTLQYRLAFEEDGVTRLAYSSAPRSIEFVAYNDNRSPAEEEADLDNLARRFIAVGPFPLERCEYSIQTSTPWKKVR